jgi:hypothetical protein
MRTRRPGFGGKKRGGTIHAGGHGSLGKLGERVMSKAPPDYNAMSPAPKFPGSGGVSMPGPIFATKPPRI